MQQQKVIQIKIPFWKLWFPILLALATVNGLYAQSYTRAEDEEEVIVPDDVTSLYISITGGAGGTVITNGICKAHGGTGAITTAFFNIGSGNNEIPAGAILRFIIGDNAETNSEDFPGVWGDLHGHRGGNSSVEYRTADDEPWISLAIADGGDGGHSIVKLVCTKIDKGSGGSIRDSYVNPITAGFAIDAGEKGKGNEVLGVLGQAIYEFDPNERWTANIMYRSIKFTTNTNKCLNNAGGSTANGTNIQTNNCDGDEKKKWIFDSDNQQLRLGDVQRKCINLPGASTSNGNSIELKDCNNTWGQRWYYNAVYKSLHSGVDLDKCMEVNNGFTASATNNNIRIYDCQYGNTPQQWDITSAVAVENPKTKLGFVPKFEPDLAIHSHTNTEVGSNIQLWTYSTTNTAMKWQFDGLKLRLNNRSDRCIDLKNGSTSNGTNVHLWECKDKSTQEWLFDGFTNTIRSGANPQKCLQVNGDFEKRDNIELWDCDGSDEQKFLIK